MLVVSSETCPSQARTVLMSTPARSRWVAVVWRLFRGRNRRHAGLRTIPGDTRTGRRNARQCWASAHPRAPSPGMVWSQVLEESEQLVARPVATRLSTGRRGLRQNLLLHCEVGFEIDLRGLHRLVAQPKSDDRPIETRLQQPHGHRVPEDMRGNAFFP